jgi:hypothetical protein
VLAFCFGCNYEGAEVRELLPLTVANVPISAADHAADGEQCGQQKKRPDHGRLPMKTIRLAISHCVVSTP